ncbi:excalibur calcium-binding domain-containing protein [Streptomyces sp. NPDC056144]|uniref:excalibur calcium-binding domain-containing protein n=1 Tax=unclassified Streptomyces TaxID=2593676 RepID=UPI0035E0115C
MTQPPPPGYGQPYGQSPYAPSPFPAPVRRWWQHPALVVVALVVFPPGGIALAWLSLWSKAKKIVATVLATLWFLLPFLVPDPPKDPADDAKGAPMPSATQSTTTAPASPSSSPSATPTESEAAVMPQLVGEDYKAAQPLLTKNAGRAYAAYKDVELPATYADWLACFQRPDAGEPVSSMVPVVYLTEPGVPCPASTKELLHKPTPKPTPTPTPKSTPAPEPTPKPVPKTTPPPARTAAPEPTEDSPADVYYRNCTAVRAAGADPIHAGEPGYGRHLDRDGDGVACE